MPIIYSDVSSAALQLPYIRKPHDKTLTNM